MPAADYQIYFAWVAQGTPWDPHLARHDESIFDLVLEHEEGQIPTATIEVKNPRIGFIAPGRLYWAWISYSVDGHAPLPLFFGRLVGIPTEIIANTVQMQFVARPSDYIPQKQKVAETLKVLPNYDPIFFDVLKRDDPDSILEGWSVLYHCDRITGRVSASEILIGEDGTVNFAPSDVFYDSVQIKLLQSPLKAINVKMEVQWNQEAIGYGSLGHWAFPTLGGDSFVGDWPKSGSGLGGGWYAGASWAGERDPDPAAAMLKTAISQVVPIHYTWVNQEKTHSFGDTMSVTINYQPASPKFSQTLLKAVDIAGLLDPYAVDAWGDPAPVNIPAYNRREWLTYRTFALNFEGKQSLASLSLYYRANRKRSERLDMTLTSTVQPILIDPLVTEDTEEITLKSGNLSLPLINLLNWSSVAGQAVALGQIIFPDNPLVPGQTSSQVCVTAGTAGTTEPVFSNISGQETVDGTVIWASLGNTPPTENAQDWASLAEVPAGAILFPKPISGVGDVASIEAAGKLTNPPTGVAIAMFTVLAPNAYSGPGAGLLECTMPGILGGISGAPAPQFSVFINPVGDTLYIARNSGQSGEFHPSFSGQTVYDGSVQWQSIGSPNLPIGGWGGFTVARTYFQQARGQQSLQHGMCRARAKLRRRARAVQISFDTRFEVAAMLSCRMNGQVTDVRIPGGQATGKIINYKIEAHGETGELIGRVTLGCSIGTEELHPVMFTETGVPSYVTTGYCTDYQQYLTTRSGLPQGTLAQQGVNFGLPPNPPNWYMIPPTVPPAGYSTGASQWAPGPYDLGGEEIGYTPPSGNPNDDGLIFGTFGLPWGAVLRSQWHGTSSALNQNNITAYNDLIHTTISDAITQFNQSDDGPSPLPPLSVIPGVTSADLYNVVQQAILKAVMQGEGLWYELVLRPLTNGPFANAYVIDTTTLLIPKTVDLSAVSVGALLQYGG
jgi:hypothetical protein